MIPNFLKLPVYALDLSDQSYKYMRLEEKNGFTFVADFGEGEMDPGIIEQGEIKKKDVLVSFLKNIFSKKNIKFVGVSLPEEKGFLRSVKLFSVKEEEVRQALEFQLEEHIPLPASEISFDYTIAARAKDHLDIVVNAFPKKIVESYTEAISSAGAAPIFAESELVSALRAIVPKDFRKTAMIIDWGKTRTSFSIFEDGILRFTSTVYVGGNALNQAIAANLKVDLKRAEELKKQYGFLQKKESKDVFDAIVPVVTSIREEAEKYISYWQSHSEQKLSPERVFLSGGDANLLGLPEYLSKELEIDCSLANPWVNIKFPPRYIPVIEFKDSLRFVSSVGVAFRALSEEKIL